MALFKCPECGERIETEGNTTPQYCPKCGYPFSKPVNTVTSEENNTTAEIKVNGSYNFAKNISIVLIIIGIVLIAIGSKCLETGFDKKDNYYNSDLYSSINQNAYVGGDAYNYIINGTYFTGYVTLASGLYITSSISIISGLGLLIYSKTKNTEE